MPSDETQAPRAKRQEVPPIPGGRGAALILAALSLVAGAQDKKDEKKPEPKVLFAVPLSVKPGGTTRVKIRGRSLERAAELKVGGAEAKILNKGKTEVPANQDVTVYGDTQVEIEVKTAADAAGDVEIEIVTPDGTAPKHKLPVVAGKAEKEPNGGFAQAMAVEAGAVVEGAIGGPKDVDVFKFEAKAGETWVFEATSARLGSPLDPTLLAHDAAGRQIAMSDDSAFGRDPALTLKIAAAGTYYVTLIDAHDMGGPTHAYLLHARK
ncbi:MAG TPA: PPC domain-containing protein [Planctomycetota bacterium]